MAIILYDENALLLHHLFSLGECGTNKTRTSLNPGGGDVHKGEIIIKSFVNGEEIR